MRPVEELLREGVRAGQFGGELEPHGEHAMGFLLFSGDLSGHVVDLGSGAGLPALVLAEACPDTSWTLIERRTSRAELLRRAVRRLGFADRVIVLDDDAGVVGWADLRGSADFVTARSFGPPTDTAEVGAPLLAIGGSLIVSEPMDSTIEERWPPAGVARCGLTAAETWQTPRGRYLRLERQAGDLDHLPRRGARKSPLF
ncbi:MAG: RsmG family class I SAM-dependent methyltransferase [Acidimicrobiales bacterium]